MRIHRRILIGTAAGALIATAGCATSRHGCCRNSPAPAPPPPCCPEPACGGPIIPAAPAVISPGAPGTSFFVQPPTCSTPLP
jgi:hypothetical protein